MKILYEGKDIYDDISLNYAVHDMHAEKQADAITLRFNDPSGLWSKWNPQCGDRIAIEQQKVKSGEMYITDITARNGIYTLRAMSMPLSMQDTRKSSWNKVRLLQLASEIASRHNLDLKTYGVKDQTYTYMMQDYKSDIAFLSNLCMLEGCQVIIYDKQLIIYDEDEFEKKNPVDTIEIGEAGNYSYHDNSSERYGRVDVRGGSFSGSYEDGANNRVYGLTTHVNDNAEATRYAKNLHRDLNKGLRHGRVKTEINPQYMAAAVFNISTKKASAWDGKCFLTDIHNDYVRNTSDIFFRML